MQVDAASPAVASTAAADDKEARFLARLQEMMGGAELTEESMRKAINSMTPEQRQELLSEGQDLKQDLFTSQEKEQERQLYKRTMNKSLDEQNLPIDKDTEFLAKKVAAFMNSSNADLPQLLLLEAVAAAPYMVKAALMEARDDSVLPVPAADLDEIEASLSLLRVDGWREGESANRSPVMRRNLLLLSLHLHRERLRALALSDATKQAAMAVVARARSLLDVLFAYSLKYSWIKALLAITELQALVTCGLWDHDDDDCRSHMQQRLSAVGLKLPRVTLRAACADVLPGEKVSLVVSLTRAHHHGANELQRYEELAAEAMAVTDPGPTPAAADAVAAQQQVAEEEGKEGWWLLVESMRGLNGLRETGLQTKEPVHNALVGWQALAPSLGQQQCEAVIEFNAPTSPGEYKVVAHVRSSSMVGVDCKRKVSFTVTRAKRALPSSNGSGSTEPAETVAAMDAAIAEMSCEEAAEEAMKFDEAAELKKKQEDAAKKAAEKAALEEANLGKQRALEASGKKVGGGMHKFDASEVDVHGGNGTADDFMDAFGF